MFKNKNYKLAFIHSVASIIIIWLIFTPSLLSHQKEGLIGLTIIIAIHLSKNPKFKKLKRRKNLNKQSAKFFFSMFYREKNDKKGA